MKLLIFFILACFFVSCVQKDQIPPDIIRPEAMEKIFQDIAEAQAYSAELARKDSTMNEVALNKVLTGKAFDLNGVNEAKFKKSYQWYTGHPDILMKVFDSLNVQNQRATLSRMKGETHELQKAILKKVE